MSLSHSPKIVTNGLVLCFDAANIKSYPGSANNLYDLSLSANQGTIYNSTYANNAIVLNGSNSYIGRATSASDSLDLTTAGTWSIWFNAISIVAGSVGVAANYLISKNYSTGSANQQYSIAISASEYNTVFAGVYDAANYPKYNFSTNTWYNMTGTYDGAFIRTYINGQKNYEYAQASLVAAFRPNFSLGRRSTASDGSTGTFFFNGSISNATVYNRALSDAEIKQNFNALRGRFGI